MAATAGATRDAVRTGGTRATVRAADSATCAGGTPCPDDPCGMNRQPAAPGGTPGFREKLSRLCMHPLTGIPLLLLVLYFGLYKFVGEFGAGTVVNFLEGTVFGQGINPWVNRVAEAVIPWQVLRELFAGEYGIITLGIRYAVAIILPIVGTFFLAFSILEDSGYLPRLAMLIEEPGKPPRPIAVVPVGEVASPPALALTQRLRRAGFAVDMGYSGNTGKRMKRANKLNACAAVLLGEDELGRDAATVRDMDSGEQLEVPMRFLEDHLGRYR